MSEADETEPTIVFAGTSVEAGLACSLLEAEGILTFLRDQHLGTGSPGMAGACGMGYVKVVVRRIDLRRAVLVLGENGIHGWKGPLPA